MIATPIPLSSSDENENETAPDAGVAGSPTSVLVNYFLKSHGGAHAVQSLCSLLASSAGFASLFLPPTSPLRLVLMKRTLLFAMAKHVAGLLGAALIAGRAIPKVGLRKARVWMEQLAGDPVSQYVFYSACILLWLPSSSQQEPRQQQQQQPLLVMGFQNNNPWIPMVLVMPILLREVVSTMLVVSDVLVLWTMSSDDTTSRSSSQEGTTTSIESLLQACQKAINVGMSLLVTPDRWKSANPAGRQVILAKLTFQVSLALEVIVGLILTLDAVAQTLSIIFGTSSSSAAAAAAAKPSFLSVMKRLICAHLYVQFLWSRKRKINQLSVNIRGGSTQLPFYVLDVLMDPLAAMGLSDKDKQQQQQQQQQVPPVTKTTEALQQQHASKSTTSRSIISSRRKKKQKQRNKSHHVLQDMDWKDYLLVVLGLDED
jgi:hypothetical protein